MNEYNIYLNLLNAIFNNAINLKSAGRELLSLGRKDKKLLPFARFLLYVGCEECGKFLLVKDRYPEKLTEKLLKELGFYDHNKKIERLIRNINKYELHLDRNVRKMGQVIRHNLRENSLYVDFTGPNTLMPSGFKNKNELFALVSLANNLIKYCQLELTNFKKNPFL
ncbi:MAG: AbiV family abortive infection protein [Elusimicrobiota bacterium]